MKIENCSEKMNSAEISNWPDGQAFDTHVQIIPLVNPKNSCEIQIQTADGSLSVQTKKSTKKEIIALISRFHPFQLETIRFREALLSVLPEESFVCESHIKGTVEETMPSGDTAPPILDSEDTTE
ncbi:hypothetical protein K9M59_01045 [Candidatus Gracilibacteria bacterium]|nr:hypothetical protein [Candidatus Gracilibacteria bacterium]MCF7819158.1 hypothetical protein [Candidatus Gracilibacteria bacterium]